MQPLRLLYSYAETSYDESARYIHHLMQAMRSQGHTVEGLSVPGSSLGAELEADGFKVHRFSSSSGVRALKCIVILWQLLKKQSYDVVNTNGHADTLLVGAAARLARVSLVVRTHHQAKNIPSSLANRYIPQRTITTSQFTRQQLLQRGMKSSQMAVVHDAVILSEQNTTSSLRAELRLSADSFLIGTVAALRQGSGAQELIQAMAPLLREHSHYHVVILGGGELQSQLETFAAQLDVQAQIHIMEESIKTTSLLEGLDLFVSVPYKADSAINIAQAAVAKLPVIGTRVGAIPEMVDQGKSGMLVPLHDVVALRKALKRLIDDTELREQMGQAGYDHIVTTGHFLLTTMQQKTEQVYRRWLEQLR